MMSKTRMAAAAALVLGLASAAQAGSKDDADSSGGYAVGPVGQSFNGTSSAATAEFFGEADYGFAAVRHQARWHNTFHNR